MFGSAILEVAIGLVFVYLLMSLICSAVNEIIEAKLKNRATDLEKGIRTLLMEQDGKGMVQQLYEHPFIDGLFSGKYDPKPITRSTYLRSTNTPSYIPAASFAGALIDIVIDPSGKAPSTSPLTIDALQKAVNSMEGNLTVKRALSSFVAAAGNDVNKVRAGIEAWFDSSMERVGGWYKRRIQWILLALGLAISIALNVNTLTIAQHLWLDPQLRSMVVAEASNQQQEGTNEGKSAEDRLVANRTALESLGLPIGWSGCDWGEKAATGWGVVYLGMWHLLGWLLTAAAISFGAPFWFDLLSKFLSIRSTVKPQVKRPEGALKDRQMPG
jgi:hypothetical protein